MVCEEALPLVEKLADGEASSVEKRDAEAHLDGCSHCREHLEFLSSIAALAHASAMALPEPPEAYWENLPRRILGRLESEEPRSSAARLWQALLAPRLLRWQAVAATMVVLAAVGLIAFREGTWRTPEPPPRARPAPTVEDEPQQPQQQNAPASPAVVEAPHRRRESRDEKRVEPPMARDEQTPPAPAEEERSKGEASIAGADSPAVAPAPALAQPEAGEKRLVLESAEERRIPPQAQEMPASERASSALAASPASTADECAELRRAASQYAEDASGGNVRYDLALCSYRRYVKMPSDAVRAAAIEDAEAFLASEKEGPRAEEIRKLLERLRENR